MTPFISSTSEDSAVLSQQVEKQDKRWTIAHVSDSHLSGRHYRENIKSLKLLLRSILTHGVDHIVVTGDIVSTAEPEDYELAREVFGTLGLLDGKLLTVVPGNHDVFGGPHRAVDVLSFPRHIRAIDYRRNLEMFQDAFAETFDGAAMLGSDVPYPFFKQVGPFGIIGLNSIPAWSLIENPLGSNGLVDEAQLDALRSDSLANSLRGLVPVVAMHHQFNEVHPVASNGLWQRIESRTMRMRKRRRLLKAFRALNVRYVLHGHVHRNELYEMNDMRLANGAGAVCDDPDGYLKYNELASASGATSLSTQRLSIPYQSATVMRASRVFPRRQHAALCAPSDSLGFGTGPLRNSV